MCIRALPGIDTDEMLISTLVMYPVGIAQLLVTPVTQEQASEVRTTGSVPLVEVSAIVHESAFRRRASNARERTTRVYAMEDAVSRQ